MLKKLYGKMVNPETVSYLIFGVLTTACLLYTSVRTPKSFFTLEHAKLHNLKDVTAHIPFGVMTVIAGVAGSGKSSLMEAFLRAYTCLLYTSRCV